MPRLKTDIVDMFLAMAEGRLSEVHIDVDPRSAATLVLVSGGYPGVFEKGKVVKGIDTLLSSDSMIFYAGIGSGNGELLTTGGRVAAVTSYGDSIKEAVDKSINIIQHISFENMAFRQDIGYEFLD
jgi:phosphoribosylamine--glycine ligase